MHTHPEGELTDCKFIERIDAAPQLHGPILDNLAARRYEPSTCGGKPTATSYTITFRIPDLTRAR